MRPCIVTHPNSFTSTHVFLTYNIITSLFIFSSGATRVKSLAALCKTSPHLQVSECVPWTYNRQSFYDLAPLVESVFSQVHEGRTVLRTCPHTGTPSPPHLPFSKLQAGTLSTLNIPCKSRVPVLSGINFGVTSSPLLIDPP